MKHRRIGRFVMDDCMIEINPAAARAVMGQVIVLGAQGQSWQRWIEYVALCDAFDEWPPGEEVPLYSCEVRAVESETDVAPTYEITWRRKR